MPLVPYLDKMHYRGGGYAILMAFHGPPDRSTSVLSKHDIVQIVEDMNLCDGPFNDDWYTGVVTGRTTPGWKSIDALLKHGYVARTAGGRAANMAGISDRFVLTAKGKDFIPLMLRKFSAQGAPVPGPTTPPRSVGDGGGMGGSGGGGGGGGGSDRPSSGQKRPGDEDPSPSNFRRVKPFLDACLSSESLPTPTVDLATERFRATGGIGEQMVRTEEDVEAVSDFEIQCRLASKVVRAVGTEALLFHSSCHSESDFQPPIRQAVPVPEDSDVIDLTASGPG